MSDSRARTASTRTSLQDEAPPGSGVAMMDFGLDPSRSSRGEIIGVRVAMAISGLVAIVLGIIVFGQPAATLAVVAVLFGL